MKKVLIYIFIIILLCFCIPIIFTNKFNRTEETGANVEEPQKEVPAVSTYDYKEYNTIKLLHADTGEIEDLNLDEYLYGVVSAEMPADFELEALKAQAIVARTYTMYKIINGGKHEGADICDSYACCQAWISKENRMARWDEDVRDSNWNKIVTAVNDTQGRIITYNGEPINAFFHSNSGGFTEIPINVWGGSGYDYLQVVETSGEDEYSQYSSEAEFTKDELIQKMLENYSDFEIDFNQENPIQILEYTDSKRVKTVKIGNKNISGVEARKIFGLRSSNFSVSVIDDKIKFEVIGYGHGVGVSQTGSDSVAKQGYSVDDIINHFYKNIQIINY